MTQSSTLSPSPTESATPLELLYPDVKSELATTRRVLERVPDGKDDWRPHDKSMTLGQLANHIAQLPGFGIAMLTTDEFEGTKRPPEAKPASNAERLKIFDEASGELRRQLEQLTWDHSRTTWQLKFRGQIVREAPRAIMLRSACITHIAHHRAQLGVYLRLLDIPVPGSYGPSADEPIVAR